jgi:hypothetical protein
MHVVPRQSLPAPTLSQLTWRPLALDLVRWLGALAWCEWGQTKPAPRPRHRHREVPGDGRAALTGPGRDAPQWTWRLRLTGSKPRPSVVTDGGRTRGTPRRGAPTSRSYRPASEPCCGRCSPTIRIAIPRAPGPPDSRPVQSGPLGRGPSRSCEAGSNNVRPSPRSTGAPGEQPPRRQNCMRRAGGSVA